MNLLTYDCEIIRGIPSGKHPSEPDIEYCNGWKDFANMGVSLISVYDFNTRMPRLFMQDNIVDFFRMVERQDTIVVGFNNWNFDDNLVSYMGVKFERYTRAVRYDVDETSVVCAQSFDLLRAIWEAAGLDSNSYGYHHQGFGLHDVCMANIGQGKRGDGELAAILFQRQRYGSLVDYGLTDIMLTAYLLELCARQPIINPKKPQERLHVAIPFDVPSISPSV